MLRQWPLSAAFPPRESSTTNHRDCGMGELGVGRKVHPEAVHAIFSRIAQVRYSIGIPMLSTMNALSFATVAAVTLVLFAGLWTMMRGSSASLSQTLMRWRVGLQFLAIVVVMITVLVKRG
jgi:hypothetical protein